MIGIFFVCVHIATGTYGPIGEIYKEVCWDIPAPHYRRFHEARRQTVVLRHQHHHYDSWYFQADTYKPDAPIKAHHHR